ncbi:hypothetical protein ACFQZ4_42250 [Catellatospora coxensis]
MATTADETGTAHGFAGDLLRTLAEHTAATGSAVWLDRGDGTGPQLLAAQGKRLPRPRPPAASPCR